MTYSGICHRTLNAKSAFSQPFLIPVWKHDALSISIYWKNYRRYALAFCKGIVRRRANYMPS